jgi:hypothetical protein
VAVARFKAVVPSLALRLMSAPAPINRLTIAASPAAAQIKAVHPFVSA